MTTARDMAVNEARALADVDGRFAHGWRAGFRRGALDALRMLGRRCCLDCAAKAEQLALYYGRAS
jgi:hypothetical protein